MQVRENRKCLSYHLSLTSWRKCFQSDSFSKQFAPEPNLCVLFQFWFVKNLLRDNASPEDNAPPEDNVPPEGFKHVEICCRDCCRAH